MNQPLRALPGPAGLLFCLALGLGVSCGAAPDPSLTSARRAPHAALCPEFVGPPGEWPSCRGRGDCATDCVRPGVRVCGGAESRPPCEADADCGPGRVCDGRPTCDQSPACHGDCRVAGCPGGWSCDAGSGHCEAISCVDGLRCGSNRSCEPGARGADEHGCLRHACVVDEDCECGACIDGLCFDGPGTCQPIPC